MNLTGRGIPPKIPKVRNSQLKKWYRSEYPYCEVCILEDFYNVVDIELHHIIPGDGRTDKKWNIISLCRKHHREATYHSTEYNHAKDSNAACFCIKLFKGEISLDRIEKLGFIREVREFYPAIAAAMEIRKTQ